MGRYDYDSSVDARLADVGSEDDATYPVSTLQDEIDGGGWVKRQRPWGGPPTPRTTAGGAD